MELKDIILDYKNRYHLSNIEIAERFQVTPMSVGRWLRGEVKSIQGETAQNMSRVLGFDVAAMLQKETIELKKPVLGMAKAGYDMLLSQEYLGEEIVSRKEYQNGDYFLEVKGDSMINVGICDGSYVYVRACNMVEDRAIAVVRIGDEVTIKRFIKARNGILLQAENETIQDRFYTKEEIAALPLQVLGKVLFVKTYL